MRMILEKFEWGDWIHLWWVLVEPSGESELYHHHSAVSIPSNVSGGHMEQYKDTPPFPVLIARMVSINNYKHSLNEWKN